VIPKTVIITGANSGIGKAAAIKFALAGHKVVMACRSIERSQGAFNEVLNSSPDKNVELLQLDVSSFDSIRKFCSEFKTRHKKLDVLIHNAAYFEHGKKKYQFSPDGIELTFATNTFGPFLMTELLKDVLALSKDPRVLNACTENIMHFFDPKRKIELDNLRGEYKDTRKYSVYKMYGDSKMALLMLTFKMAEEYKSLGIKMNAIIIPGVKIAKDTMKKMSLGYRLIAND
jgi:NAD(P)-dependent dehydrogenase (short-subunit alcohol dehydrogenase family)